MISKFRLFWFFRVQRPLDYVCRGYWWEFYKGDWVLMEMPSSRCKSPWDVYLYVESLFANRDRLPWQ